MLYLIGSVALQIVAWVDFLFTTILLYILSFIPEQYRASWYPALFRSWCWIFIRALGVELKLHQKNRTPLPPNYLVISNHPSVFEDLGMSALFKARFLAKEELKHWWILGRISTAIGTLYVKRNSKESRKLAKEALMAALLNGENVGVYPEGGCKGRRISLPFKFGSFDTALKTGVHILPVFLHYESQADFEWRDDQSLPQILWKIFTSQNKRTHYYVFDAIDPKQFSDKFTLGTYIQNLYIQWQDKYLE